MAEVSWLRFPRAIQWSARIYKLVYKQACFKWRRDYIRCKYHAFVIKYNSNVLWQRYMLIHTRTHTNVYYAIDHRASSITSTQSRNRCPIQSVITAIVNDCFSPNTHALLLMILLRTKSTCYEFSNHCYFQWESDVLYCPVAGWLVQVCQQCRPRTLYFCVGASSTQTLPTW